MAKRFKPHFYYPSVLDIDLDAWWEAGIRGLILDVDDTLTLKNSALVSEAIQAWLDDVHKRGFQTYIVSNNRYPEHIARLSKRLDIPAIAKAGKPFSRSFKVALEDMNLKPEQAVAIGDRVMTDIAGAIRLGIHACLVDPMTRRPTLTKRFLYAVEKQLKKF